MQRIARCLGMTLGIILALHPCAWAAGVFKDVDEGHWAERPIALVALSGVIRGYSDGTFRPERPLSRLEAVVLIQRSLFADAEIQRAMAREIAYPQYGISRSGGLLELAFSKGVLRANEIAGNDLFLACSRLDAARYIYRAMQAEGYQPIIRPITFPDLYHLSGEDAQAVSAATNAGLMGGKLGGLFVPEEAMTRAAMASLVCRMFEFSGKGLPGLYVFQGEFVSLAENGQGVRLVADSLAEFSYTIGAATRLYQDGVLVAWSQLVEGQRLYGWIDQEGSLRIAQALPLGFVPFVPDHYFIAARENRVLASDMAGDGVVLECENDAQINGLGLALTDLAFGDPLQLNSEEGLYCTLNVQRTMERPLFFLAGKIMAVDFAPDQLALMVGGEDFRQVVTVDIPVGVSLRDSQNKIIVLKENMVGLWGRIKGRVSGDPSLRRMQAQEVIVLAE